MISRILKSLSCTVIFSAAAFQVAHADIATAKKIVQEARTPITKWYGPKTAPKPAHNKLVYVVTCTSQGIGCVRAANGVQEAGAALGWTVRVIDGKADPATWNSAIQSAIAAGANGIVLDAVPPSLVGDALEKAAAAKVKVVSIFIPPENSEEKGRVFAYVHSDHLEQGKVMAAWTEVDSGGKANIGLIELPEYPELVERVEGFKKQIADCSGCKLVTVINQSTMMLQQRLPGAVAQMLTQNPTIDYVIAPVDRAAYLVIEGARQAGRAGKVKVAAYEGAPQELDSIRQGTEAATLAGPVEWMGWQAVDELNRAFNNAPPSGVELRYRLLDHENVPAEKVYQGDLDFRAQYKRLWGVN